MHRWYDDGKTDHSLNDRSIRQAEKIKKNRASLVGKLSKQGYHEYMNTFVNQELEVLIETIDENGISHGHSSEYIPTAICQKLNPNQLVKVIGSKLVQDEFYAKVKEWNYAFI